MSEFELKSSDENSLAKAIRDVLGVGPYEKVIGVLPQFERQDGKTVDTFPLNSKFLDGLKRAPQWVLRELGLQPWDEDFLLWLFPSEWYEHIPEGYTIHTIMDETEKFKRDEASDDRRRGALAYGIHWDGHSKSGLIIQKDGKVL